MIFLHSWVSLQAIVYTLRESYKELALLVFLVVISGFIFARYQSYSKYARSLVLPLFLWFLKNLQSQSSLCSVSASSSRSRRSPGSPRSPLPSIGSSSPWPRWYVVFLQKKNTVSSNILIYLWNSYGFSRCVFISWFFSAEYKSKVFSRWVLLGVFFYVCSSWCVFLGVFLVCFLAVFFLKCFFRCVCLYVFS